MNQAQQFVFRQPRAIGLEHQVLGLAATQAALFFPHPFERSGRREERLDGFPVQAFPRPFGHFSHKRPYNS